MEAAKVNLFICSHREFFPIREIPTIKILLSAASEDKWDELSYVTFKNPMTALMLSIFGGLIGVDRIYIGDYFWGIVKTITCGGLIIWSVIDIFLLMGATKRNNYNTLFTILNS